jgi:hypothetical protein
MDKNIKVIDSNVYDFLVDVVKELIIINMKNQDMIDEEQYIEITNDLEELCGMLNLLTMPCGNAEPD